MLEHADTTGGSYSPGLQKIIDFCNQAASDGFEYVWADTCCIDKSTASELAEAINSMFRWYQESTLCYAYLADVPSGDRTHVMDSAFRCSRWFTRGWTLQELIAPKSLVFYSKDWKYLSNKSALSSVLSEITGIDSEVLSSGDFSSASVSMKLSWASSRTTSRIEDQAYCLVGFFGIFMPPIYGEGEEAFQRLQREIIKTNNDQTIFSWAGDGRPSGMLARASSRFIISREASSAITNIRNPDFTMTNRGLRISLPMLQLPLRNLYAVVLNSMPLCGLSQPLDGFLVHFIYRLHDGHCEFVRVFNDEVALLPLALRTAQNSPLTTSEVYIGQPRTLRFAMNNNVTFCLKDYPFDRSHPGLCVLGPWDKVRNFSSMPQSSGQPHLITMQLDDQMPSAVLLFKNDAGQQIAACLTLWGQEIKVGLSTEFVDDDMSRIADAFLFGQSSMVVKQPGSFSVQASPRRGKKVSLILDEPTDHASMGTACNFSLNAANGFWLHAVGPGVWPGCWTRYFDSLATATPVKERTGIFRRKTLEKWAQLMT
ncbi:HET domain-containing protein [Ophiostoma piceae UAMH 11346]|uniref:HET domain-containing protein n=1 Tax=Ophiostoma piceae (strain UAMH 11346) TaxID=1262450 RepID=S3C5W4_OPHP1|nr:HET domain-containing protein [Ophiostoma piceae UAMH 11346]